MSREVNLYHLALPGLSICMPKAVVFDDIKQKLHTQSYFGILSLFLASIVYNGAKRVGGSAWKN
ncbi:MAG: hypothetical protein Ct9H300mP27_08630 [Chloroflexota bacterium]|nr:MAG: hypothetical protein Ct9H300mP27_08630 [Chloroflexota bacterium]